MSLENIKKIYQDYTYDPDCVYKSLNYQNKIYMIILQKLPDTKTNELRNMIANQEFAKFRASHLKVLKIFNIEIPEIEYDSCINSTRKNLDYKKNEIVYPDEFDNDLNRVCTTGIHYFKSIDAAFYYMIPENYTGTHYEYDDYGRRVSETHYINGIMDGKIVTWFTGTEQIRMKGQYFKGEPEGIWNYYTSQGKQDSMEKYVNGRKVEFRVNN
jgi:antitoxin component YwqK of YwqJK toxin-antitoxin module